MKQREIKFRIWDSDKKQFINLLWGDDFMHERDFCELFEDAEPNGIILSQYTGLKDKNGKEIYEGDIVKHLFGIGEVFMRLGCWFVSLYQELGYIPSDNIEVIGNIYENPELLTKTN